MRKRSSGKKDRSITEEEQAFNALVGKFSKIQYLVEQKATVDVIEKAPVGICITNKDYVYEYVNDAYCRIYGYQFNELVGNKFTMVVPAEYQQQLMDLHDQFIDQEYELEGEWEVVAKSGELKNILANAAYVIDEQRRPKKITFVLDITERKKAQSALENSNEQRNQMVETIKGKISGPLDKLGKNIGDGTSEEIAKLVSELNAILLSAESKNDSP